MKILALKLVTGEEIIGQVTPTKEGRMAIEHAVTLRMFPSQIAGGQPSMGFQPFPTLASNKEPSVIMMEPLHVVYSYVPDDELVSEYNRMFSEGTSSQQIITG